jgi:hypothetical protein
VLEGIGINPEQKEGEPSRLLVDACIKINALQTAAKQSNHNITIQFQRKVKHPSFRKKHCQHPAQSLPCFSSDQKRSELEETGNT